MNNPLFFCIAAAVCFGSWPLIARPIKIDAGWLSLLVCIGTALVSLTSVNAQLPTTRTAGILIFAGCVNGVGMLMYSKLLSNQQINVSGLIPIAIALSAMITGIGVCLFYGEPFTMKKIVGIGLAFAAVYLLH